MIKRFLFNLLFQQQEQPDKLCSDCRCKINKRENTIPIKDLYVYFDYEFKNNNQDFYYFDFESFCSKNHRAMYMSIDDCYVNKRKECLLNTIEFMLDEGYISLGSQSWTGRYSYGITNKAKIETLNSIYKDLGMIVHVQQNNCEDTFNRAYKLTKGCEND